MSEKNCDWAWSPYRFINIEQWLQENNDKKSEMAGQKKMCLKNILTWKFYYKIALI